MGELIETNVKDLPTSSGDVALGQWYWVKKTHTYADNKRGIKAGDAYEWLGCVMTIGSNYVELNAPKSQSYNTARVHFDNFWDELRFEPNANEIIQQNIHHYQEKTKMLLGQIQNVTARLGIVPTTAITQQSDSNGNSLAVLSSQVDVKAYENALILAKEKTLPDLFKEVEESNRELSRWMLAPTMPLQAQIEPMKDSIDEIKDRIFNVSLYAGLTEKAVQCSEGVPAEFSAKLHVMQRRLYMD